MRKPVLILLAILVSVAAMAQNTMTSSPTTKAANIAGTISLDGKTLVTDEDSVWAITNPDVLKGREGQHLALKCKVDQEKHTIHVLFIKSETSGTRQAANWSDSAFRR